MRDQIRRTCLPSGRDAGIFELPSICIDRQPHRLRAGDLFERSSTILFAENGILLPGRLRRRCVQRERIPILRKRRVKAIPVLLMRVNRVDE